MPGQMSVPAAGFWLALLVDAHAVVGGYGLQYRAFSNMKQIVVSALVRAGGDAWNCLGALLSGELSVRSHYLWGFWVAMAGVINVPWNYILVRSIIGGAEAVIGINQSWCSLMFSVACCNHWAHFPLDAHGDVGGTEPVCQECRPEVLGKRVCTVSTMCKSVLADAGWIDL
jgi:hypothetical protein